MTTEIENFLKQFLKKDLPEIRPGDLVKVHQKIKTKDKEKKQIFEGIVIARKHGKGINATITVRKEVKGVAVEKIFPLHSPTIEKIEILQRHKVRRAKLYYLRKAKGKKARLKRKEMVSSNKKTSTEIKKTKKTAEKSKNDSKKEKK